MEVFSGGDDGRDSDDGRGSKRSVAAGVWTVWPPEAQFKRRRPRFRPNILLQESSEPARGDLGIVPHSSTATCTTIYMNMCRDVSTLRSSSIH